MIETQVHGVRIFVEKSSGQWIVQDPDGDFWVLPCVENPWDRRLPFHPAPESDLAPIPRHYKNLLGLPF
jgi:hypothetical protein